MTRLVPAQVLPLMSADHWVQQGQECRLLEPRSSPPRLGKLGEAWAGKAAEKVSPQVRAGPAERPPRSHDSVPLSTSLLQSSMGHGARIDGSRLPGTGAGAHSQVTVWAIVEARLPRCQDGGSTIY